MSRKPVDGQHGKNQVSSDERWRGHVSTAIALRRGLRDSLSISGLILFSSSAGFGALANDAGMSLFHAAAMMATFFALPAQVVLVDQLSRGGSLLAGAFAVMLTAVRMVPLVVSIMPLLRGSRSSRSLQVIAVHGLAITGWVEGMRRLPLVPRPVRLVYFAGLLWGFVALTIAGTIFGYLAVSSVPPVAGAVLLFVMPIYFLLSMIGTQRDLTDGLAIVFGCILGPIFFHFMPGLDLLLCAVVGGGAAYLIGRRSKRHLKT